MMLVVRSIKELKERSNRISATQYNPVTIIKTNRTDLFMNNEFSFIYIHFFQKNDLSILAQSFIYKFFLVAAFLMDHVHPMFD